MHQLLGMKNACMEWDVMEMLYYVVFSVVESWHAIISSASEESGKKTCFDLCQYYKSLPPPFSNNSYTSAKIRQRITENQKCTRPLRRQVFICITYVMLDQAHIFNGKNAEKLWNAPVTLLSILSHIISM